MVVTAVKGKDLYSGKLETWEAGGMSMQYAFFVDFDGTITLEDTCDMLLMRYGNSRLWGINEQWENKEISTRECITNCLAEMRLTPEAIHQVVREAAIDPHFKSFLAMTQEQGYPVYIVSDGYAQIIQGVLARECLQVPYYANELHYDDHYTVSFPHFAKECGRCGTCKTSLIKQLAKPGVHRVYLGDGTSDFCAAAGCDTIFARGKLAQYCRAQQIPYRGFQSFQEVLLWWETVTKG